MRRAATSPMVGWLRAEGQHSVSVPLIKPDVPISGIRLSGWLHSKAHDGALCAGVGGTDGLRLRFAVELPDVSD